MKELLRRCKQELTKFDLDTTLIASNFTDFQRRSEIEGWSADVWRDLVVEGGPDGILARRPITMKANPQGYVYDLWLVERLADRLGA